MLAALLFVLSGCVIAQWVLIIGLNRRFSRQTMLLRQFFRGPNGEDLEALLGRNLTESREALANSQVALARAEELSQRLSGSIQHFALERYDAFEDVTGQQSFSLALLDGRGGGAIVTALFGRNNSRCFGKVIEDGQPQQPLTEEEQKVLIAALERKVEQKVGGPARNPNGSAGKEKRQRGGFLNALHGLKHQKVEAAAPMRSDERHEPADKAPADKAPGEEKAQREKAQDEAKGHNKVAPGEKPGQGHSRSEQPHPEKAHPEKARNGQARKEKSVLVG